MKAPAVIPAKAGIQELDPRVRGGDGGVRADDGGQRKAPDVPGTPLLPGWHTLDPAAPALLGARCKACGTYYFPKNVAFCRNPKCEGEAFEEVALSRGGTLWSWTDACYAPPEPFVAPEPYQPFAIAAVELAKEKMVVLGPVVAGVKASQLKAGMAMELALEPLADGKLTWKWRPCHSERSEESRRARDSSSLRSSE